MIVETATKGTIVKQVALEALLSLRRAFLALVEVLAAIVLVLSIQSCMGLCNQSIGAVRADSIRGELGEGSMAWGRTCFVGKWLGGLFLCRPV